MASDTTSKGTTKTKAARLTQGDDGTVDVATVDIPDEDTSEGIEPLGKSGWLLATIDGKPYRLRRPFFGELRDLRLALEAATDAITMASDEAEGLSADIMREVKGLREEGADILTDEQRERHRELQARSRKASRALVALADDQRIDWWRRVFDTLSVDGMPDDWPSWVVDADLPHEVTNHWRSVPLGPGRP